MNRVFVVGDTHGTDDIKKIYKWYNKNVANLDESDVLIQLGDWGAMWYYKNDVHKYKKDLELQIRYTKKKFTLAVVPGNHENYDLIEELPIEERWGGKVSVLTPMNPYTKRSYGNIYLLQRGEVYKINGKTFLTLGGAMSQDKAFRNIGESWWEQELWSQEEELNCLNNLDKVNWKVDYVIAHTCPLEICEVILGDSLNRGKSTDPTSKFFSFLIKEGLKFKEWEFGHFHEDIDIEKSGQLFKCHYNKQPFELDM